MSLFSTAIAENILPVDGEVFYYGVVVTDDESIVYFKELMDTIHWKQDELILFGKKIVTKRKVAWYGDLPYEYSYSNTFKKALPWTETLLNLKQLVESKTNEIYNSCLLNLYHDGTEGMSWHSDDEVMLVENASIASLSIGVDRKFGFKHKESKEKVTLLLENGSLIEMKGSTQKFWQHALPKTKKVISPRINLTFRRIVE